MQRREKFIPCNETGCLFCRKTTVKESPFRTVEIRVCGADRNKYPEGPPCPAWALPVRWWALRSFVVPRPAAGYTRLPRPSEASSP